MDDLLCQISHLLGQQALDQFDADAQVLMRWRMIDDNLKLTREAVCELRQHIANAAGKYVNAPYMQHIIAAA
jgi:predicted RNA-binding protein